ncbi:hypothetical protein LUZ60_016720 [Juncus effusus]|nr:hypothetical protein LUZ60_016720 [Juncus effusus]
MAQFKVDAIRFSHDSDIDSNHRTKHPPTILSESDQTRAPKLRRSFSSLLPLASLLHSLSSRNSQSETFEYHIDLLLSPLSSPIISFASPFQIVSPVATSVEIPNFCSERPQTGEIQLSFPQSPLPLPLPKMETPSNASLLDPTTPQNGNHNNHHIDEQTEQPITKKKRLSEPSINSEFAHHDSTVARINNGSFGSCPASVLRAQSDLQNLFLAQPDKFYFETLKPSLLKSRLALLPFIGCSDPSSVALVDNVTTAASIVLQHVAWQFMEGRFNKGDVVLMLHYAYGSVKKSIRAYVERAGATIVEVPLPFPVSSDQEIIDEFRKSLALGKSNGRKVRLAVIDHITSMPSVVIPVRELVQICREEGVDQVFIDAAHSIGQVDVNVDSIGADYYTSNLHKWFFCPPAVAFLHTRTGPHNTNLHHPVVSHEYGNGLPLESGWIGTRDYSPQLVIPQVIDFVNKFEGGIEGIRRRNHAKVVEMGRMLGDAWGTELGAPEEMCGSMVMVGLPGCLEVGSESDAMRLRGVLRGEYKVEVPIYYNERRRRGKEEEGVTAYVRISHQVYNVEADYFRLRDAVLKLVEDGFRCSMLDD